MATWILLLLVHTTKGTTVSTAEFNSQKSCEVAARAALSAFSEHNRTVSFVCAPK